MTITGRGQIRAVIFDFFGTLVPSFSLKAHTAVLRQMAVTVGAPSDGFVQRWIETFDERVTGVFPDVESNIRSICTEFSVEPGSRDCTRAAELRFDYERQHLTPRPHVIDMLRELRKRGYKIGLISDCSSELPILWGDTVFAPLFDVTIFSHTARIRKPNPEIYGMACKQLGVSGESCLYVGDGGSRELSGAAKTGMVALLLLDPAEAQDPDVHRVDGEAWGGAAISELSEIFTHLKEESGAG